MYASLIAGRITISLQLPDNIPRLEMDCCFDALCTAFVVWIS